MDLVLVYKMDYEFANGKTITNSCCSTFYYFPI